MHHFFGGMGRHFGCGERGFHHMLHAHARRGHFGHGGRPGAPGEPGMEGFGLGRKLRSADLQLLILSLLGEQPRHGYELIKAIDERSQGYYVPSPGMIYPALSYLEEVGHAKVDLDGTKKRYSLTPEGEAFLAENRATADALIEQLARMGERMARAREAWSGEGEAAEDNGESGFFGRFRGRRHLAGELHEAFHALKHAVRACLVAGPEEQRRIAGILKRAAEEIARRDGEGNDQGAR
ncbi:PadR family transcriptional regulator [Niveibacterium sp. SC-1]|uniref:PadR family transcriptional regulator n=1 Tax=Niveibacterium sp. SC-1 TaxID=3135646 RepID=UPI00311F7CAF